MKLRLATVLSFVGACAALAQDKGKDAPPPPAKESRPDSPVAAALDWLARHQDADGVWRGGQHASRCQGAPCAGKAERFDGDTGVTALALLAFVGAGHTHKSGVHGDAVKNAAKFLRDMQPQDGFIGVKTSMDARLQHAYAAMAMTELYGMTGTKLFKPIAQRAATCTASLQDAAGGWKRKADDAECDAVLTGVCVLSLRSARMSELDVEQAVLDRAVAWLDKSAPTPSADARTRDAQTAAALGVRVFGRWDFDALAKDERWAKDTASLFDRPPLWTDKTPVPDLWTWCLAAPPLFQRGGDAWTNWWKAFSEPTKAHQRVEKDVCARGSWDPVDPRMPFGGRVATTALVCRALETPYLFGRLGAKK
jgi:hypothetical protein